MTMFFAFTFPFKINLPLPIFTPQDKNNEVLRKHLCCLVYSLTQHLYSNFH